jgi:hypothetical protein
LIFARRGILILHRHAQVRFYEIPENVETGRWNYRELYSIYTPSAQAGLLRADIDGDGHADILCGNYWLRSPETAGGSWRLFAINQWWDGPRSAMLRTAMTKPPETPFPVLFAAQMEASPAKLAWFERPPDPRQLWIESPLETIPPLRRPQAMTVADLNGDLRPDLLIGENAGARSRMLIYWALGGGKYQAIRVDVLDPVHQFFVTDADADSDLDIVGLGRNRVWVWLAQRRK